MPIIVEKACALCGQSFTPTKRKQGGGRQKYCSNSCNHKSWLLGNPQKRKAALLKYESKPQSKEVKRSKSRHYKLKSYGWTEENLNKQLHRQSYKCYGCLLDIDKDSARIDHCHKTGKVRGLLCNSCNWALGHAKDAPATLRRLMAHLDYDINKTNIYLAGALKNKRIPEIGNLLRVRGYDVMDEWFTPGEFADTNWQAYEKLRGRSYIEALNGRSATNTYLFDRAYLDHCDIVIFVAPAGKSAMLELGYAIGFGKKTCLFLDGEDPERYDVMPGLIDFVFKTEEALLDGVAKLHLEIHSQ